MATIRPILDDGTSVLFEGQMRISFIKKALADSAIRTARIVLVDCNDATRAKRLRVGRGRTELANSEMMNWARYPREESLAADIGSSMRGDCHSLNQWILSFTGSTVRDPAANARFKPFLTVASRGRPCTAPSELVRLPLRKK